MQDKKYKPTMVNEFTVKQFINFFEIWIKFVEEDIKKAMVYSKMSHTLVYEATKTKINEFLQ